MGRAGEYVTQPGGYRAFRPAPLPPVPALELDRVLLQGLSKADRALGRLDGVTSILPNPDLFVAMYVRQEAVLSSQIEGTQSTLEDILAFEAEASPHTVPRDVEEVVNYVRAMQHGIARLRSLPLSLRLIREIHGVLLEGVRGGQRTPGEFRQDQNWIGPAGCSIHEATFVPPAPLDMRKALADLEAYLHTPEPLPVLLHCGRVHAQFETIHPFMDGNGRVGRLLITFLLCERDVLRQPLLYLSHFFKQHRSEYYDRLTAIRESGAWEPWLAFFLRGVAEVSEQAAQTARTILQLREEHRQQVMEQMGTSTTAPRLLDHLYAQSVVSVRTVEHALGVTYATAAKAIDGFVSLGLLQERTGGYRNRLFQYEPYLRLFDTSRSPLALQQLGKSRRSGDPSPEMPLI